MDTANSRSRRDLLKALAVAAAASLLGAFPLRPAAAKDADDGKGSPEGKGSPDGKAAGELLGPTTVPTQRDRFRGLKVGVASYSFRKIPLDATLRGIQRLGLHYASIKDAHLSLKSTTEERKAVAQKFRDAGITPLSCGNIALPPDEAVCRNALEYARDIGATAIVCNPDPAALPLLDKLVKEFDLRLAIHNHGPEDKRWPSPYEPFKAIEKLDPRIGLCIDVGHAARAGVDPAEAIRTCRARVYDVHFKDVTDIHGKNGAVEIEVGRGVLDVASILRALLDIEFTGHVGFEHEPTPEDPLPGLAESTGFTAATLRMMR